VTRFEPHAGMPLWIGDQRYIFQPHPVLPPELDEPFVIEGGEALVYQLLHETSGALCALKVSKPQYRGEHIVRAAAALAPYASLPGLYLGNRVCLTRSEHDALLASYPDLEFATLMPWIEGRTWAGQMLDRDYGATHTVERAVDLARRTAHVLWSLEAHHLAHTDIAGANVILSPRGDATTVELLDVEYLYSSSAPPPVRFSTGTPGYQHPHLGPRGQWDPHGDRFAGAILLTELLVWADPAVRVATPIGAETLFQPSELQRTEYQRFEAVRDALWAICPPALPLFDQAWTAPDLASCPELSAWALALLQLPGVT
jgi:hypothetical protein